MDFQGRECYIAGEGQAMTARPETVTRELHRRLYPWARGAASRHLRSDFFRSACLAHDAACRRRHPARRDRRPAICVPPAEPAVSRQQLVHLQVQYLREAKP